MRLYGNALGLVVAGVWLGACGPRVSVGDLGSGGTDALSEVPGDEAGGKVSGGGGNAHQTLQAGAPGDTSEPVCEPGETVCLDNQIGTCAPDGLSLTVSDDCRGNGQVCDTEGACSVSVVDEIGAGRGVTKSTLKLGAVLVNVIDTEMPRVVTKLESRLALEVESDLVWLIYEWNGSAYELQVENATVAAPGDGFYASEAFSYELEAGKRYALGVYTVAPGGSTYQNSAPTRNDVSFGVVLGGNYSGGYDYRDGREFQPMRYLPQLRITTERP